MGRMERRDTARLEPGVDGLADNGLEILDEHECVRLLHGGQVGRLAFELGDVAAVMPVNYEMLGSDILFFTGAGAKLDAALESSTVTFEVDEIDAVLRTGWSVLATGKAERADGAERVRVEALGLYPWAAGDRHHLIRIRPNFFSGRRILA